MSAHRPRPERVYFNLYLGSDDAARKLRDDLHRISRVKGSASASLRTYARWLVSQADAREESDRETRS